MNTTIRIFALLGLVSALGCYGAGHAPAPSGSLEYAGVRFYGDRNVEIIDSAFFDIDAPESQRRFLVVTDGKRLPFFQLDFETALPQLGLPEHEVQQIREEHANTQIAKHYARIGSHGDKISFDAELRSVCVNCELDSNSATYGIAVSESGPVLRLPCKREEVEAMFGKPTKVNGKRNRW